MNGWAIIKQSLTGQGENLYLLKRLLQSEIRIPQSS
jgi:hypothetical protein